MKRMVKISMLVGVVIGIFVQVGFAAEKMKNVVIDIFPNESFRVSMADRFVTALMQAGFVEGQNVVIHRLSDPNGDVDVAQIRQLQPDVILDLSSGRRVAAPLRGTSMPVLLLGGAELFVEATGLPRENISGLYTTLKDMVYNSYKFLRTIAPLKPGQQAVFLENRRLNLISGAMATDALQRLQIPLKAVVELNAYEDFQDAILKYNDDPDVGWILLGIPVIIKRDGTSLDNQAAITWCMEHLKKPTVTYWENAVQLGLLAGFGMDFDEAGTQLGEMAARVLQGEDIKTIKAEYPRKVNIALNRKTATNLGIVFSLDVLNLADVIYDDYEGKQVIRK